MIDDKLKRLKAAVKEAEVLKKELERKKEAQGRPRSLGQVEHRLLTNGAKWIQRVVEGLEGSTDRSADRLQKLAQNAFKNITIVIRRLSKLAAEVAESETGVEE